MLLKHAKRLKTVHTSHLQRNLMNVAVAQTAKRSKSRIRIQAMNFDSRRDCAGDWHHFQAGLEGPGSLSE